MKNFKTYPEMNKKIVGILRLSDEPTSLYAAQRIEELEGLMSIKAEKAIFFKCDQCGHGQYLHYTLKPDQKNGTYTPSDVIDCDQCGYSNSITGTPYNYWIHRDDALPDENQSVIVFSPEYSGKDSAMEYRIMSGEFFVLIAKDAEYWMIPKCDHIDK